MKKVRYGIFTKPIHVEKLVNYLNMNTDIDYIISTSRGELVAYDFDIGVSYCFPYIVDVNYPLTDKRKWFNYHPAPLPEYPGINDDAIYDKVTEFGVTLHMMTNKVDKGRIIKVRRFKLDSIPPSPNELGSIAHYHLFQLFKETIESLSEVKDER